MSDRASQDGAALNSAYYRERFGSQSPEEYKSLRITNIDPQIHGDDLRGMIEKIFLRYGDMNCKLIRQNDIYDRIVYVNFEFPEDAKHARHQSGAKLTALLGRKVRVDPANVLRDQTGKFMRRLPQANSDSTRRSRSPQNFRRDDNERFSGGQRKSGGGGGGGMMGGNGGSHRPGSPGQPRPTFTYNLDDEKIEDPFATRTLFVGNLEIDITISELRNFFERFGVVEEIDIKTPHEAHSAYAFIRFSDILAAREARKQCCGEYLRDNKCKIGWGKPIISRRLWVGGLGPDTSLAWLEKEFDRYGAIDKIDFARGDSHAYVLFTSPEAAAEAWKKLKGVRMRNGLLENIVQVDFADSTLYEQALSRGGAPPPPSRDQQSGRRQTGGDSAPKRPRRRSPTPPTSGGGGGGVKRRRSPSASPPPAAMSGDQRHRRHSPPAQQQRQRNGSTPAQRLTGLAAAAEFSADTLNDLYQMRSPIWTGVLVLKRSAYPLQLYKLAGDDDLVDAYLRNERGESVQLNVGQRLRLDQPRSGEILRVSALLMQNAAYLLAVPNPNVRQGDDVKLADMQAKHLRLMVKYFREKEAAGVVSLTLAANCGGVGKPLPATGVVYAFPQCMYADDFVSTLCPRLNVWREHGDQCLILVLQKGSS